ncbi:MAG: L,D-transpeptidase family protein [Hyphomicrobiaceae bacterium]
MSGSGRLPHVSRRSALWLGLGGLATVSLGAARAERFVASTRMKPGSFTWNPERAPEGAVVVICSLPEQLVHIYRGGIEIGVSTCSTGRPGHRTPTGVFAILEKQRHHVSSIYKGAQMPNMERLTWGGIALHAGNLPGYPASHGCVRLPMQFSRLLFGVTHLGTVVIIADERTQPFNVVHPGPLLPGTAVAEAETLGKHIAGRKAHGAWDAEVHYPVTSVVVSRADGKAHLLRDGRLAGSYPVRIAEPGRPLGTHVYSLIGQAADGSGLGWLAFGVGSDAKSAHIVKWQGDSALKRITFRDPALALEVVRSFHPGTTLVVTDARAGGRTRRTPEDFRVIASDLTS